MDPGPPALGRLVGVFDLEDVHPGDDRFRALIDQGVPHLFGAVANFIGVACENLDSEFLPVSARNGDIVGVALENAAPVVATTGLRLGRHEAHGL